MAKINVIKKSKDLTQEIDKVSSDFNTLSRNAHALEKKIENKKAAFAKRDQELKAKAEQEAKLAETKVDVAEDAEIAAEKKSTDEVRVADNSVEMQEKTVEIEAVQEKKENVVESESTNDEAAKAESKPNAVSDAEVKEKSTGKDNTTVEDVKAENVKTENVKPESVKPQNVKRESTKKADNGSVYGREQGKKTSDNKNGRFGEKDYSRSDRNDNRSERSDNRTDKGDRTQRPQREFNKDGRPQQGRDDNRKPYQGQGGYAKNAGIPMKDKDEEDSSRKKFPSHAKNDSRSKDKDSISSILPNKPTDTNRNFGQKIKDKSKKTREEYWDDGKPASNKNNYHNSKQNDHNKNQNTYVAPERKKAIVIGDTITVKDFSESVGISVAEIVKKLMSYGIFATINNEIDFDTAQLVSEEFGIVVTKSVAKSAEDKFDDLIKDDDDDSVKVKRPPIVTVMGHVDHGKTSLLDVIRNSNVTDKEAGGITQHIGAYTVNHKGNKITFLDTPGHEAFTTMRSRGAKVTDVAVIVVAANDGVMPQTIEAIHHAKAAGTPIIIAMNKIDIYGINPETVKKQLAENDILVEDWGGDVACIPVSAKTREGIDDLLEMILLVAEMQELKANPDKKARGTIIEARLDKSKGPVATVLVQNGTLREGETVVAGMTFGNVRAMFDHYGKRIKKAGPSIPVEVTGLGDVPQAGDMLFAIDDSKLSRNIVEERIRKYRETTINASKSVSLEDLFSQINEGDVKSLNLIIKADVQGSVEAVKQSLEKLSNDEVKVVCIHGAVGAITEADVSLAKASSAIIIGFNVRTIGNVDDIAQASGVDIRNYSIIYNAIDDVTAAMKGMLAPIYKEVIQGRAEVRMTFKVSGVGTVAGAYVIKGKIHRHDKVRVLREGIVIFDGELESLKRFKDDVKEVAEGYECGICVKGFNDVKEMDVFEAYSMEEVERK